jgi:hypothetical protein
VLELTNESFNNTSAWITLPVREPRLMLKRNSVTTRIDNTFISCHDFIWVLHFHSEKYRFNVGTHYTLKPSSFFHYSLHNVSKQITWAHFNWHSSKLWNRTFYAFPCTTSYSYIQLYDKAKTYILKFKERGLKKTVLSTSFPYDNWKNQWVTLCKRL